MIIDFTQNLTLVVYGVVTKTFYPARSLTGRSGLARTARSAEGPAQCANGKRGCTGRLHGWRRASRATWQAHGRRKRAAPMIVEGDPEDRVPPVRMRRCECLRKRKVYANPNHHKSQEDTHVAAWERPLRARRSKRHARSSGRRQPRLSLAATRSSRRPKINRSSALVDVARSAKKRRTQCFETVICRRRRAGRVTR